MELIEIIEHAGYTPAETVELLMDLLHTSANSRVYIEDYAIENGICPDCCCEMTIHRWTENHPYGSTYASEQFAKWVCPECGESY
jgi:predicted RNA-binding Zn-ribbon protein involved in translation (DUF1610 family)